MASEISVERQFHFHCSCGSTIVTGERTVNCTACGVTLGVRRVRRHRQDRRDSVAYYGGRRTLPVRRVERLRQNVDTAPPMAGTTQSESVPNRSMPLPASPVSFKPSSLASQPVVSVAKENVDNRTPITWWQRFVKRHIIDGYPYNDSGH